MRLRTAPTALAAMLASALGVVLAAALATLGASPAAGHEGTAVITVESAVPAPAPQTAVDYVVRVTWQNDGHPADGTTVTVTAIQGDGVTLTPVAMTPVPAGDGRYQAVVPFPVPGAYTVRFTAVDPTGTLEQPAQVAAPVAAPPTTPVPAPTAPPVTPTTVAAPAPTPTTAAPAPTAPPAEAAAADDAYDGDDGPSLASVGLVLVVLVAGGAGFVALRRRKAPPAPGPA